MTKTRKRVASFFVCLIILLGFSGFVFYLGWTQIKVPVNNFGFVVSKTNGFSDKVVENGEFSWNWQFLLPSNAELRLFSLSPRHINKKISGKLSSADTYSAVYKEKPDFSYNFDFDLTLSVSKDEIIRLNKAGIIEDSAGLENYENEIAEQLVREAVQKIIEVSMEKVPFLPETVDFDSLLSDLNSIKKHPEITFTEFTVRNVHCPDMMLYTKAREIYLNSVSTSVQVYNDIMNSPQPAEKIENKSAGSSKTDVNQKLGKVYEMLDDIKTTIGE